MKTGEVAKMMGLNPKTITNWTDQEDLVFFFSDGAKSTDSSQRDYNSDDILVINTVRVHKTRRNSWSDVAELLATGHRETELPLSATLTKSISPVDQLASMMAIKAERDTALAQLEDSLLEIERLRKQDRERQGEIIDLHKQIARLELRLEMLQEKLDSDDSD